VIAQIQSGLLIFVYYKLAPNYILAKLRSFRGARNNMLLNQNLRHIFPMG